MRAAEPPGPRLRSVQPLRIALAQVAPRLGDLEANLARHHELLEEARGNGAGLVVFPELGLTGYLLQDLAAEVAMRLDDPRLASFLMTCVVSLISTWRSIGLVESVLAANGLPTFHQFFWVTVAMASARTLAFAVNRWRTSGNS